MTLKEMVASRVKEEIKYHLKNAKAYGKTLKEKKTYLLAEKLQSCIILFEEPKEVITTVGGSLTIHFGTFEAARDFVSRVMNKLGLEKVERLMEQYSDEPVWYYNVVAHFTVDDQTWPEVYSLSVYPAQPVEDCMPKRTYEAREPRRRWVCEKGE